MKGYEDLVKLINFVQASAGHILDTSEAAICEYQDMIGNSTDDQLRVLANDDKLKYQFYRIYGMAYGTVEAIQFFTKHNEKLLEIVHERDEAIADREDTMEELKKLKDEKIKLGIKAGSYERQLGEAEEELARLKEEIVHLKARLFDLISK